MLILSSVIVLCCVFFNKISDKFGLPALLAFILLGMLFGSDGLFKIEFDNYKFAEEICSVGLVFIIFYGGFGTKWSEAKKVAGKSLILASAGVLLTAFATGAFCKLVLGFEWLESLLIGAVISSTDAASVFSVLRSKKLNLRYSFLKASRSDFSSAVSSLFLAIAVSSDNLLSFTFSINFYTSP